MIKLLSTPWLHVILGYTQIFNLVYAYYQWSCCGLIGAVLRGSIIIFRQLPASHTDFLHVLLVLIPCRLFGRFGLYVSFPMQPWSTCWAVVPPFWFVLWFTHMFQKTWVFFCRKNNSLAVFLLVLFISSLQVPDNFIRFLVTYRPNWELAVQTYDC